MLADAYSVYSEAFFGALQPDPVNMTVSQWADEYRMLSSKASSEPGRWRTDRTPYLREPMDCASPQSPVSEIVLMYGSQLGKTEFLLNTTSFYIDMAPCPILMIQPTMDMVKKVVRQRLEPAIADTPRLMQKVADRKSRDASNTTVAKDFPGGILMLAGSNSPSGLASMPIRVLLLDEVDRYPGDVDGEGDPVNLAKVRTRTYQSSKKILITSTPTEHNSSRVYNAFQESDQSYYYVPCPECGHRQTLKFGAPDASYGLKWPKGKPDKAEYLCEECGSFIQEYKKTDMLAKGLWIPQRPEIKKVRGFHLNSLYSPLGWYSWAEIASDFEKAKNKPSELKTFVNTVLAETWQEKGDAPEWENIYRRREEYEFNKAPKGVLFITAGADVQRDRIEIEIVGWGRNKENWSIDYRVLKGDTSKPDVWKQLWAVLCETWDVEDCGTIGLSMMAVDSSDQTQMVYSQVRAIADHRVMAIKGQDGQIIPVAQPKSVDIDFKGKKIYRGCQYWPVGVSVIKQELYGWFRQEKPIESTDPLPEGFCHWPQYENEYFKQLTAESRIRRTINGQTKYRWEKKYERNEALDCRVYARASAYVFGLDKFTEEQWQQLEERFSLPEVSVQKTEKKKDNPFLKNKQGKWI